jgi:CheY-like chemotaxis protein
MPDRNRAVSIVMIEDDEGHARLIEKNIRRAGVNNDIVPFGTGWEALAYLHGGSHRPCLILLDLNLPDMTGMEILAALKSDERTRRSPVIVLTTTDDKREIRKCYDHGANLYITKPLNYDSFADAIRQLGLFLSVIQVPEQD